MSETDELVVTHLRLCACGKPAGHESVCFVERIGTDERVSPHWESTHADTRREHSDARKRRISNERRSTQAAMTDWELVELARQGEMLLSTVKAANSEPSGTGGESQRVGPTTQLLDQDPRWRLAKRQLRRAAEQLLDLEEEIRGHGIASVATTQLGEHKDAEILKCVGLKPREVVRHLGSEVAGGSRTVERVRETAHSCRWCGQDWPS